MVSPDIAGYVRLIKTETQTLITNSTLLPSRLNCTYTFFIFIAISSKLKQRLCLNPIVVVYFLSTFSAYILIFIEDC
jgi:hypothetical protein